MGERDKDFDQMKKDLAALKAANNNNKSSDSKPKPKDSLKDKLNRTCRNWNNGVCSKEQASCPRKHACNRVTDGRVCWLDHRYNEHNR